MGAQSTALEPWTERNSGTTRDLLGVAYGQGSFVAVGGLPPFDPTGPVRPSLLTSTNGTDWISLSMPTNVNLYGVSFVNDRFIGVGDSGLLISSADAMAWSLEDSAAANRTADIYPLGGVAFGNGTYVAMDRLLGNSCLVSSDATNWTAIQLVPGSSFVEMDRVRFANGLFVAGGIVDTAALLISTNGVNWLKRPSPVAGTIINDVAYGKGRWIAVGDIGAVVTSVNGSNWTSVQVPPIVSQGQINLHGVAYADGLFVAAGDSATLMSSFDGLNWNARTSPGASALNAVTFGNGSFVAAGLDGSIWQSGPLLHLDITSQSNGAALSLSAPAGLKAMIQSSADLITWTNLLSIAATIETQTVIDTNTSSGWRFYRALAQ